MTTRQPERLKELRDSEMTLADSGEDVRGRSVVDRNGDEIGKVDALLLDEAESKVRFLRVEAGGFLGIGARQFLVPVDAVTRVDAEHVHVDRSREGIVDAPAYDPNLVYEQDYYGDVYGYWGYAPYWAPGYAYPAYPFYGRPVV